MGILIAKFRSKPSTIDVLEQIEKDITRLQKFRLHNQQQQKKFIGCLILYSIVLYIIAALVIYFVYFPPDWKNRLLYSSPLLIFPVLIWLIKKFLHWYFVKRITKNDLALNELRENRKQILEDVMEKETYKKAREILQKFDPARFKELEPSVTASPTVSSPGTTLRQRGNASGTRVSPQAPQRHPTMQLSTPGRTPGPPLPRPILPRERSTTDRLLEYLVGDGPQNRFALICRYCHSHNGMALKEEFEYLSFRCCYCYQMNLAKKQKPYAPKLDTVSPTTGVRPLQKPSGAAGVSKPDDEESESESDEEESSDETSKEINGDDFVTTSQHNTETEEEIGQTKVKGEVTGQTGVGGQEIETITSSVDSTAEDVDGVYPLEEENGSDLENKGVPDGTKSDEIQEEGAVAQ
ncbi:endoplasmic reticulum junction formation protein lunapark-B-like isoform X2 [Ylistrum balloti]|uniref:endoplasmic reticulum junction formation protein lunapark-B-like isoform X2 n=1 Tax=Ylistrum balloti TaxID=509963 RepID=UPI002905EAE7|nr:endoplasmic reticulum junction formation protein lunapark-B-like isoform X2 [Ylistrum balloti]